MATDQARPTETALIARYFAPLCEPSVAFGLSDDAAFLRPPQGNDLVLSKDMLVADRHFFAHDDPKAIAKKALRVNLSDLAAKGAEPYGYLLGLGLPEDWNEEWLATFCKGLAEDQKLFDFPLFGGDTVKASGKLTLSITAFGLTPSSRRIIRTGAQAGDAIYVSGTIGDSALGLACRHGQLPDGISEQAQDFLRERFLIPQPRLSLTELLRNYATASMDISDGLLGDLQKLLEASNLAATIQSNAIPYSDAAREVFLKAPDWEQRAQTGGDDYELLFTVPGPLDGQFSEAAKAFDIPVTRIGQMTNVANVTNGQGITMLNANGERLPLPASLAWDHF